MLLADPKDAGLPANASNWVIVRPARAEPAHDEMTWRSKRGRKFHRIVYRWNGSFYAPSR